MAKKAEYTVPQWLLYATDRLLVSNCRAKLAAFAEYSPAYTDEMLDLIITKIDAAEALPGEEMRNEEHSEKLEELKPLFKTCQRKFMYLKGYITLAFPKNLWLIKLNSAGWDMYDTEMNWNEAQNMYAKSLQFIADNKTALLANDNMPVGFDTGFEASINLFKNKLTEFETGKIVSAEATDAKIDANNDAYHTVIDKICSIGQTLFSDDETLRGEFSFEKMSEVLRPTGPAGLKGVVTIGGVRRAGLIVELENGRKSVITNGQGEFDFGNKVASGNDTIIVKDGDEILGEEDVTIPPGVTKHEDVDLPAPPPVV